MSNCGGNRVRRQTEGSQSLDSEGTPATIEVYSGLYVNEVNEVAKEESDDPFITEAVSTHKNVSFILNIWNQQDWIMLSGSW